MGRAWVRRPFPALMCPFEQEQVRKGMSLQEFKGMLMPHGYYTHGGNKAKG